MCVAEILHVLPLWCGILIRNNYSTGGYFKWNSSVPLPYCLGWLWISYWRTPQYPPLHGAPFTPHYTVKASSLYLSQIHHCMGHHSHPTTQPETKLLHGANSIGYTTHCQTTWTVKQLLGSMRILESSPIIQCSEVSTEADTCMLALHEQLVAMGFTDRNSQLLAKHNSVLLDVLNELLFSHNQCCGSYNYCMLSIHDLLTEFFMWTRCASCVDAIRW
jgi:hypothetical protein